MPFFGERTMLIAVFVAVALGLGILFFITPQGKVSLPFQRKDFDLEPNRIITVQQPQPLSRPQVYELGAELDPAQGLILSGIVESVNLSDKQEVVIFLPSENGKRVKISAETQEELDNGILTMKLEGGLIPGVQEWIFTFYDDIEQMVKQGDQIILFAQLQERQVNQIVSKINQSGSVDVPEIYKVAIVVNE